MDRAGGDGDARGLVDELLHRVDWGRVQSKSWRSVDVYVCAFFISARHQFPPYIYPCLPSVHQSIFPPSFFVFLVLYCYLGWLLLPCLSPPRCLVYSPWIHKSSLYGVCMENNYREERLYTIMFHLAVPSHSSSSSSLSSSWACKNLTNGSLALRKCCLPWGLAPFWNQ